MSAKSRAIVAGILSLGALGAVSGVVLAAPAPAAAASATAALATAPAQSLVESVHYRCVVRRCGPYRCVWINRCRRPYWWY